jgi:hypothetical protein
MMAFNSRVVWMPLRGCVLLLVWPLFAGAGNDARRKETVSIPTVTVMGTQFLNGAKDGKPTTITGELRLPGIVRGPRVPAVVLVHGAGGIDANTEPWAEEITSVGVAVFVMDGADEQEGQ